MSADDNKSVVATFVRRCQDQHDLAFADELFHPRFVNHYRPEGRTIPSTERPASGFQSFYGALLRGFPDATMEINEQIAERDLVATRKTLRGTHLGELWDLAPTGNRVEFEFIDIFRTADGKLIEHVAWWTPARLPGAGLRRHSNPAARKGRGGWPRAGLRSTGERHAVTCAGAGGAAGERGLGPRSVGGRLSGVR